LFVEGLNIPNEAKDRILANLNPENYVGLAVSLAKMAVEKYENFKKIHV